jgi:hypothetical protein
LDFSELGSTLVKYLDTQCVITNPSAWPNIYINDASYSLKISRLRNQSIENTDLLIWYTHYFEFIEMTRSDLFYEPPKGEKSGLPHDPFKSFVIPRPIGWISTTSVDGIDNLGPFSQFNNVSFDPPTIMFVGHQSVYKRRSKDSVVNARETGEFVWNMATWVM